MGQSIVGHGTDAGITEDGFSVGSGSRIAVIGGLYVRRELVPNVRETCKKSLHDLFGLGSWMLAVLGVSTGARKAESPSYLLGQVSENPIQGRTQMKDEGVGGQVGVSKISGENHRSEVLDDRFKHLNRGHGNFQVLSLQDSLVGIGTGKRFNNGS